MSETRTHFTAFIVDDEFHARENLIMMIEEFCPDIAVIGQADGVNAALREIPVLKPDLLFLDIRMPSGAEGFDLLEKLGDGDFQVIFVTAFKDYAVRAFQANAIHYLLKPVDPEELQQAIQKVLEYKKVFAEDLNSKHQYQNSLKELGQQINNASGLSKITLHHSKGFRIVELSSIIRLEASGNCTWLFFRDGSKYFDTRTLGTYEEILPANAFLRVHKSHMISANDIREYQSGSGPLVVLTDSSEVPISRARLSDFLLRFKS
jgi:two-component system, LytTR family, response regulator